MERCGAQAVTFIASIVLAGFLEPAVYVTVALITIITSILQVFLDVGFSAALIQKYVDDLDFPLVFFFNIIFELILYALLFISSHVLQYFTRCRD